MNKKISQLLLAIGLVFIMQGCSKDIDVSKTLIKTFQNKSEVKHTSNSKLKKLPPWVSNPNVDGYVGVVSIVPKAKIKNKKKLYYIAKLKARAAFETRKGTNIDSSSQIKTNTNGKTSYSEQVKISSFHIQTDSLVVKDTFEDKDNFYMWMVVK